MIKCIIVTVEKIIASNDIYLKVFIKILSYNSRPKKGGGWRWKKV